MSNIVDKLVQEIKEKGYTRVENFISPFVSEEIEKYIHSFNNKHYTEENLLNRICFKREEGKNRQGDAYMVSKYESTLGSIELDNEDVLNVFDLYNSVLEKYVGKYMNADTRAMLNSQIYYEKSYPVVDHYDGCILDFEHTDSLYGEKALIVNKALLPRLVAVLVLRNENENGTYIRKHDSKERIDIPNKSYDLIIFDNIIMRHGVPELEKPRMMIGFRNFDYHPYLFNRDVEDKENWEYLHDEVNPGYIKPINEEESLIIQKDFIKLWKTELAETQLKKDAAF